MKCDQFVQLSSQIVSPVGDLTNNDCYSLFEEKFVPAMPNSAALYNVIKCSIENTKSYTTVAIL